MECQKCRRSGIQLWRPYGRYPEEGELVCGQHVEDYEEKYKHQKLGRGIGAMITYIPAIRDDDGGFWGFTTCPLEKVRAWESLSE